MKHRTKHPTTHHYKNILLACTGLLIAVILSRVEGFRDILLHLGTLGYAGAFLAGMLFVSTFTAPTGIVMLFILAQRYTAIEIGLIAGAGAVLTDSLIFHFVKDDLSEELHVDHIIHSKHFRWTMPVIGALIIASPLPDELGVTLMGISKMTFLRFAIASFIMHSIGIFLVISYPVVLELLH